MPIIFFIVGALVNSIPEPSGSELDLHGHHSLAIVSTSQRRPTGAADLPHRANNDLLSWLGSHSSATTVAHLRTVRRHQRLVWRRRLYGSDTTVSPQDHRLR